MELLYRTDGSEQQGCGVAKRWPPAADHLRRDQRQRRQAHGAQGRLSHCQGMKPRKYHTKSLRNLPILSRLFKISAGFQILLRFPGCMDQLTSTLPYSSKINCYLYVSSEGFSTLRKKRPDMLSEGGCPSSRVCQPSADSNGRLASFLFEFKLSGSGVTAL
jgi:hypothetical protein